MHLPAVQCQLVARCRYRRQLPLVIVELLAVYCLPLWVTVINPLGLIAANGTVNTGLQRIYSVFQWAVDGRRLS